MLHKEDMYLRFTSRNRYCEIWEEKYKNHAEIIWIGAQILVVIEIIYNSISPSA